MRLGFIIILFFPIVVTAQWKWTVPRDTQVFSQPNKESEILADLEEGSELMITNPTHERGWVIIHFEIEGHRTKGYVEKAFLSRNDLQWVKKPKKKSEPREKTKNDEVTRRKTIGLGLVSSFYTRGPTDIASTNVETVSFGQQYGISYYPQVFYDFPYGESNFFRIFFSMRTLNTEAEAELRTNGVTTLSQEMNLAQSFMSIGFMSRSYVSPGFSWFGFGMEYANGTAGEIKYNDGTKQDLKETLPTLIFLQGHLGFEVLVSKSYYFLPTLSVGFATTSPLTLNSELNLAMGWIF